MNKKMKKRLDERFAHTLILEQDDELYDVFMSTDNETHEFAMKIHDGRMYMYRHVRDKIILRDVTPHMERQKELFHRFML